MPNITEHTTDNALEKISGLIRTYGSHLPRLTEALKSLLTAIEYQDDTLIRSSLNVVLEFLKDEIEGVIEKKVGSARIIRNMWLKIKNEIEGHPRENWDDLGNQIKSIFRNVLDPLVELNRDLIPRLQKQECEIENAFHLENEVNDLQLLEKEILGNWPWSGHESIKTDRAMVAESMSAIKRGESNRIQDIIRSLGGEIPSKS